MRFNAFAPQLWRRVQVQVIRELARIGGVSQRETGKLIAIRHARLADHQSRFAIHFHAISRLDHRDSANEATTRSSPFHDVELLATAIGCAARSVKAPVPQFGSLPPGHIRFGDQTDIQTIVHADDVESARDASASRVAAYLSKYLAKGEPLAQRDLSREQREFCLQLQRVCRAAAEDPQLRHLNLERRAETLGFPSYPASRSPHFSTTMAAKRKKRTDYNAARRGEDLASDVETIRDLRFAGSGWRSPGFDEFVQAWANSRSEMRGKNGSGRRTKASGEYLGR